MRGIDCLLWSVLASTSLGPPALQAQPSVFKTEVTSVFVDAFVTDKGAAVKGLTAGDFGLKDDGVPQKFEIVSTDSLPIRLILAFDVSGSVQGPKLERLQDAARQLLDRLRPQDEVGLVAFSSEVAWPARLSSDHDRVRTAVTELRAMGGTSLYDGLFSALLMPRSALQTLVVVFSDGADNTSWLSATKLRRLIGRFNAVVYVVAALSADPKTGLTDSGASDSYIRNLRDIAEVTGGSLLEVDSPDRIRTAFTQIMDRMKNRYVLRYDPENEPAPGWHRLDIELKSGKGKARGRSGYWVEKR